MTLWTQTEPNLILNQSPLAQIGDRVKLVHVKDSVTATPQGFDFALVGQGKWTSEDVAAALAARDRAALGFNAPPEGLYFVRADYPND